MSNCYQRYQSKNHDPDEILLKKFRIEARQNYHTDTANDCIDLTGTCLGSKYTMNNAN